MPTVVSAALACQTDNMEELILRHLPKDREKLLVSRGVPQADLIHGASTFDVVPNLVKYETDIPGMQPKTVGTAKQLKALASLVENPIRSSYAIGINSFPSDLLAKHLAIHIFDLACKSWALKHKPGRTLPVWHRVFGGLNDQLRDKTSEEIPSLIVISNINDSSSAYKLEKVRDLLEKYSHVPRIVVMSAKDPITFFATKLHYPINAGFTLGPNNRIKML